MVERTDFGKLRPVIEPPNLIEIQTKSYADFLQMDFDPSKRKGQGLQAVFREVFPIESYDGRYTLDFVKYELSEPKMGPIESLYEGASYTAPLHVTFRLKDGDEVREEVVYMGEVLF
jgi:DNA-directed RNA polymerase subunit beta